MLRGDVGRDRTARLIHQDRAESLAPVTAIAQTILLSFTIITVALSYVNFGTAKAKITHFGQK